MKIIAKRRHDEKRRQQYLPVSDQLDAAMKGLEAVRQSGMVALPAETVAWLDHCKEVKALFPKE